MIDADAKSAPMASVYYSAASDSLRVGGCGPRQWRNGTAVAGMTSEDLVYYKSPQFNGVIYIGSRGSPMTDTQPKRLITCFVIVAGDPFNNAESIAAWNSTQTTDQWWRRWP